jgi:enediyne biosynthesis protein E7
MTTRLAQRVIPGPGGGSAARILAQVVRNPLRPYLEMSARYGDAVRMPIAPKTSFYLLSRPEHAEHVLAANQDNYVKAFTYRPLRALIGNGLLTSEGEDWRRHRRLIQPAFSRRDVLALGPAMTEAAQRMLKRWDGTSDGAVIDVAAQMSALTLDVAGRALFSTDLTGDAEQMRRAMGAGQRVAMVATLLPLSYGPWSTRAVKAVARRAGHTEGIEGPVGRLMAARRASGQLTAAGGSAGSPAQASPDGEPGPEHRDLLDILMTARNPDGSAFTDAEIADEVSTFMLAGHETTANTLSWSLALLAAYPAARSRLEHEVDSVLGGRAPASADAARLEWTTAVISEAMRIYPPAWTIERDAIADDDVAGVPVPAGSLVAVPPYLVHRHPEFWPDPAGFDPDRFSPGAQRHRYAYIPFGGGKRACIGQSFAELETVLVLASIAQRFRLELTASGIPQPAANITLRPRHGLRMRLLRRA